MAQQIYTWSCHKINYLETTNSRVIQFKWLCIMKKKNKKINFQQKKLLIGYDVLISLKQFGEEEEYFVQKLFILAICIYTK